MSSLFLGVCQKAVWGGGGGGISGILPAPSNPTGSDFPLVLLRSAPAFRLASSPHMRTPGLKQGLLPLALEFTRPPCWSSAPSGCLCAAQDPGVRWGWGWGAPSGTQDGLPGAALALAPRGEMSAPVFAQAFVCVGKGCLGRRGTVRLLLPAKSFVPFLVSLPRECGAWQP